MRQLLRELSHGIHKHSIPPKFSRLITDLIGLGILSSKKNLLTLEDSYKAGIIDVNREGVGFVSVFDSEQKDLIIESKNLRSAIKGDTAIVQRLFKNRGRPSARVVYILERKHPFSLVYLSRHKQMCAFDLKTDTEIRLQASQKSLNALPEGAVLKIDNRDGSILEVLGVLSDPTVDEKISLALYNKIEPFSKKAELEAAAYGTRVDKSLHPERTDLTHLPFCTIDPPDAKDHDDAIYFDAKESILYVAIADVSEYVTPSSFLDKEAEARGFSIYLPHKSIPMLPRALSENICSLKEHEDRLAFIYKARLHKRTKEPLREEFFSGVIRSVRKYSYDRVDEFLAGDIHNTDATDNTVLGWLLPLFTITQRLRQKRLEKGYDFSNDEIRMELDKQCNLIKTRVEKETPSHSLIEECMLLANKSAARQTEKGIYRIHEAPAEERIKTLLADIAMLGIHVKHSHNLHELVQEIQKEAARKEIKKHVDKMIIRAQKQASYSHKNVGHFGLGFEHYAHFTSPIRRYSDLILHRLLKAILANDHKKERFLLQNIEAQATKVSELEREAAKVEWDYQDRKFARWANEHIGEQFDAIIVDTDRMPIALIEDRIVGARVFLKEMELDSFQKVRVEILEVHLGSARIYGRAINPSQSGLKTNLPPKRPASQKSSEPNATKPTNPRRRQRAREKSRRTR